MERKLLSIREAAQFLGVSIDTLRRWDKSGKLVAHRKNGGTHRFYVRKDLEAFSSDTIKLAYDWALSRQEIPEDIYCPNSAIFQARLLRLREELLSLGKDQGFVSLVEAVVGEVGNNSYDHNLGNWPDVVGVFFGYDTYKGIIVLADRGVGVLKTLQRVRPSLIAHEEALRVAFTEKISGRAPESRGNGLKFVRKVVLESPMSLSFQTGDAELRVKDHDEDLRITKAKDKIRGCLVILRLENKL